MAKTANMKYSVLTTDIRYQVETDTVFQTSITSLRMARWIALFLKKKGVPYVQIARYDKSLYSEYYEVVEQC